MKFHVDRMLGKLARLLRLLGYDAEYVRDVSMIQVEEWCKAGSIFLTKGSKFQKQNLDCVYIVKENYPVLQLKEVINVLCLELDEDKFFSRCLECNTSLERASPDDVQRRVPEFVKRTKKEFYKCNSCRRIYWEGSHRAHMQEIINTVRNSRAESNEQ